jgi:hypothetical protein
LKILSAFNIASTVTVGLKERHVQHMDKGIKIKMLFKTRREEHRVQKVTTVYGYSRSEPRILIHQGSSIGAHGISSREILNRDQLKGHLGGTLQNDH